MNDNIDLTIAYIYTPHLTNYRGDDEVARILEY